MDVPIFFRRDDRDECAMAAHIARLTQLMRKDLIDIFFWYGVYIMFSWRFRQVFELHRALRGLRRRIGET